MRLKEIGEREKERQADRETDRDRETPENYRGK